MIARPSETHHWIRCEDEHTGVTHFSGHLQLCSMRRLVDLCGRLRRDERTGAGPDRRVHCDRVTIDQASAMARGVDPGRVAMVVRRQETQRASRERSTHDAAVAAANHLKLPLARPGVGGWSHDSAILRCGQDYTARYSRTTSSLSSSMGPRATRRPFSRMQKSLATRRANGSFCSTSSTVTPASRLSLRMMSPIS